MKTYHFLLTALVSLLSVGLFAQQQYDIRFQLEGIDCQTREACYIVQIRNANGQRWNLAGQNYRIYYDGSMATYISSSVESRLPDGQYSAPLVSADFPNLDGSDFPGELPFSETLGFLNYSIDLGNLSNGGVILPANNEWLTTSSLCFRVPQSTIDNPSDCVNLVWARMGRTDSYATAFIEVSNWLFPNSTVDAMGIIFEDMDANNGSQACLSVECGGAENENTTSTCSDGIDNDEDGLVDCADSNCSQVRPCRPENNSYDINMALSSVDCVTGMACYNIELRSSGEDFTLGDQNYRLFYNSEVGSFASVVSRLSDSFQPATLERASPIENENATGIGNLSFESDLGFVDFSINLVNRNAGSDLTINRTGYTTTAEICFNMTQDVVRDADTCFETAWARPNLTRPYSAFMLNIEEWLNASDRRDLDPTTFNDLSSTGGNRACFSSSCALTEVGEASCSDTLDNDNDGLIDCQDPDCGPTLFCGQSCAAQAPTLSEN